MHETVKRRPVRGDAAKGARRLRRLQQPLIAEEKWCSEGLAAAEERQQRAEGGRPGGAQLRQATARYRPDGDGSRAAALLLERVR